MTTSRQHPIGLVVASMKETANTQGAHAGVTLYYEPLLLSLTDYYRENAYSNDLFCPEAIH